MENVNLNVARQEIERIKKEDSEKKGGLKKLKEPAGVYSLYDFNYHHKEDELKQIQRIIQEADFPVEYLGYWTGADGGSDPNLWICLVRSETDAPKIHRLKDEITAIWGQGHDHK